MDRQRILDRFLTDLDGSLAGRFDAVLYGSAARKQGDEHSDLNVLVILDRLGPEELRSLTRAFAHFREAGHEVPLVLTRAEWATVADAFPIEVADMRAAYTVLRGQDPVAPLVVQREDLRRALENEWRGKLLRLRQGYIAHAGDPVALGHIVAASARPFLVLARVTLLLLGEQPPTDARALLARFQARLGLDGAGGAGGPFAVALEYRSAPRRGACPPATFEQYLAAVERASHFVDHLQSGDLSR